MVLDLSAAVYCLPAALLWCEKKGMEQKEGKGDCKDQIRRVESRPASKMQVVLQYHKNDTLGSVRPTASKRGELSMQQSGDTTGRSGKRSRKRERCALPGGRSEKGKE
jgi:hypothetical protein